MKHPLGIMLRGSLEEIIILIRAMVEREKPAKIVTVGDRVSQDLTSHQLFPDVLIIDNRVMRKEITPIPATAENTLNVRNPPGTITDAAWQAVETAMEGSTRTKITVDGEEDLLALVAVLAAPEGSLIFYGQPYQGVVAVRATAETKQRIRSMIEEMRRI